MGATFECPEILHKNLGGLQKMADVEIINTLGVTLVKFAYCVFSFIKNDGLQRLRFDHSRNFNDNFLLMISTYLSF